jgi:acetyl esterase/lipase
MGQIATRGADPSGVASDTFDGMQLPEQPGPPGPFATLDEVGAPRPDALVGGTRYADIEFARVMGYRPLRMDLVLPPVGPGPFPVVVWVHGGAFLFGSRQQGPSTEPACRALLERGVAVAQVEYRFSGEALFPACLHDVKAAVRWLRRFGERFGVNGEAIGVWGESAGGHLALFTALHTDDARLEGTVGVTGCSSRVRAGVAWCPDTDFLALGSGPGRTGSPDPTSPEALLIGGATRDRPEDAAFASPVTHAPAGAAPVLLVHGLEDRLLPPQQSALMHEALHAAGSPCELEWVEGADHVLFGVDRDPIAGRSADFLVRHLTPP